MKMFILLLTLITFRVNAQTLIGASREEVVTSQFNSGNLVKIINDNFLVYQIEDRAECAYVFENDTCVTVVLLFNKEIVNSMIKALDKKYVKVKENVWKDYATHAKMHIDYEAPGMDEAYYRIVTVKDE